MACFFEKITIEHATKASLACCKAKADQNMPEDFQLFLRKPSGWHVFFEKIII